LNRIPGSADICWHSYSISWSAKCENMVLHV
jgi:hypothetical protein